MGNFEIGLIGFGATLVLMALRMPVGIAMLFVGAIGYVSLSGWQPLLSSLNTTTYSRFANYHLSVVPLFLLMGHLATQAGVNSGMFRAASAWFGHLRGGLAIATIGGCAMFGAICGSSLATAATMSQVAMPEMRKYRYSNALITGTLAAGGTLGILIPPSVVLVIYAIYTEQSIGKLFLAAIIPGLIATVGYMIVVSLYVRIKPDAGPAGPRASWSDRFRSILGIWHVVLVFAVVVIGIYAGWFSPTEGAAVGAAVMAVLAVVIGGMRWRGLRKALLETMETSALIFLILLGAEVFNVFLALSQMPSELARAVGTLKLSPMVILGAIMLVYLILGCVMESLAMVLLTLPVFYPIILAQDFGLNQEQVGIWFGILALTAIEMGMITPPFGLNLFVINAMAKDVPIRDTYVGVLPFVASDIVRTLIVMFVPATALLLPGLM